MFAFLYGLDCFSWIVFHFKLPLDRMENKMASQQNVS